MYNQRYSSHLFEEGVFRRHFSLLQLYPRAQFTVVPLQEQDSRHTSNLYPQAQPADNVPTLLWAADDVTANACVFK